MSKQFSREASKTTRSGERGPSGPSIGKTTQDEEDEFAPEEQIESFMFSKPRDDEMFYVRIKSASKPAMEDRTTDSNTYPSRVGIIKSKVIYEVSLEAHDDESMNENRISFLKIGRVLSNGMELTLTYSTTYFVVLSFKHSEEMEYFKKTVNEYRNYLATKFDENPNVMEMKNVDEIILKIKQKSTSLGQKVSRKLNPSDLSHQRPVDFSSEELIFWLENYVYVDEKLLCDYDKISFKRLLDFISPGVSIIVLHRQIYDYRRNINSDINEKIQSLRNFVLRDRNISDALRREIIPFLDTRSSEISDYLIRNENDQLGPEKDYDELFKQNKSRFYLAKYRLHQKFTTQKKNPLQKVGISSSPCSISRSASKFSGGDDGDVFYDISDLEGKDRASWDLRSCRDNMLSILLFKENLNEFKRSLKKKFRDFEEEIEKRVNEGGQIMKKKRRGEVEIDEFGMEVEVEGEDEEEEEEEEINEDVENAKFWIEHILEPFNERIDGLSNPPVSHRYNGNMNSLDDNIVGIQDLIPRVHFTYHRHLRTIKDGNRKISKRYKVENFRYEYRAIHFEGERSRINLRKVLINTLRSKKKLDLKSRSFKKIKRSKLKKKQEEEEEEEEEGERRIEGVFELGVKQVLTVPREAMNQECWRNSWFEVLGGLRGNEYGLAHSYLLVGNLAIHWGDESIVRLDDLDYRGGEFYEIFACDTRCPVLLSYNTVLPALARIAEVILDANLNCSYSQIGGLKLTDHSTRRYNLNCQEFVDLVLKTLGRTKYYPLVENYLRMFRQITVQYNKTKKSDVPSLRFMIIPKILATQFEEDFEKKREEIEKEDTEDIKIKSFTIKRVSQGWFSDLFQGITRLFSFGGSSSASASSSDEFYQVYFRTHRDIDDMYKMFSMKIPDFKYLYPATYMLLKSFCRSFWIRMMKLKRKERIMFTDEEKEDWEMCKCIEKCPMVGDNDDFNSKK